MNLRCFALVWALISPLAVIARDVQFRVVSFEGQKVDVNINGATAALTAAAGGPYFTGTASVADGAGDIIYLYVVDGKPENGTRILPSGATRTYNDLIGRTVSYRKLPLFPNPFPTKPKWTRESNPLPLYDDGFVPILHITAPPEQINQMDQLKLPGVTGSLDIFYADAVDSFQNVIYAMHKDNADYAAKRAVDIGLTGSDSITGRKYFKLRDLSTEPSLMREVTYTHMLRAAGVICPNQVHVRLYVNKVPYGLFAITDYVQLKFGINGSTWENFPATAFHNGNPTSPIVNWFDGSSGSFGYFGEDPAAYNGFNTDNPLSPNVKDLIPAIAVLDQIKGTDAGADKFATMFDVDQIFVSMVFEYLTSSWDNYWSANSNFGLYLDPETKKWFYIPQDFDYTFSMDSPGDVPTSTYIDWEQGRSRNPSQNLTAPLINNLLAAPAYRKRFEETLISIVSKLFNPVAFNRRITAHADLLSEDVRWDLTIPRKMVGKPNRYQYEDFVQSINGTVPVSGTYYSLTEWVAARAGTVAKQFNFQWDAVVQDDASPATPGLTGDAPGTGSHPNGPGSGTEASTSGGIREVAEVGLGVFVFVAGLWVL
ncbi:hypothetical protein HK097_007021 [Rhizophlyctis rosea]|uniref:Uncharacterized protein n=1 Tax=Rhizophlyctis rosea TaxID=64517 RepID=A0AAD5SIW9_9FUNG|nr:hypothetical protein HK097_007021 [Rhizophlyctis rosea]